MASIISNRYEIISLIGQGGMADVYLAKDTILNREVAIKVLRKKLSEDAMTLVRFQREASAASRLSHPNVVDIYDVGEFEGMHYIVMEYIKGKTLKQLIQKRGALSVDESLYIMKQLTSAVVAAHEHDIIHRDIKPQNVLMKADGTVKITDFGIAVASNSVQLTLNNAIMGSAHYLAPETAQGKEPNPQIDVYSLGIVFYELLTGEVPYRGKSPTEIALKHLKENMPSVRAMNPNIPQSVENIVLKASAKNVLNRYESAKDLLYDLQHCLDSEQKHVKKIVFEYSENVNIKEDAPETKQKSEKKETNLTSILVGSLIGVICVILLILILLVTGIVRFDGFLGYETMPNLINLTEDDAIKELSDENFDVSSIHVVYEISDEYEKGRVISTSVSSGKVVKSNSDITVVVCKGPSFLIEDYTGLYLTDVLANLNAAGVNLDVQVEYEGQKDTNPGIILQQKDLDPGKRIDPSEGVKITFVVSDYPSVEISAEWIGMNVEDVKTMLNNKGIAVVTRAIDGIGINNTVVSISPDVGTTYTQEGTDSVVTLFYN